MASAEQVKELQTKLNALVLKRFGAGHWRTAFDAYDSNHDEKITAAELSALLEDAGVGNFLTRSMWVSGVLAQLDKDTNASISWPELQSVIVQQSTVPATATATPASEYLYPTPVRVDFTPKKPKEALNPLPPAPTDDWLSTVNKALEYGAYGLGAFLVIKLLTKGK